MKITNVHAKATIDLHGSDLAPGASIVGEPCERLIRQYPGVAAMFGCGAIDADNEAKELADHLRESRAAADAAEASSESGGRELKRMRDRYERELAAHIEGLQGRLRDCDAELEAAHAALQTERARVAELEQLLEAAHAAPSATAAAPEAPAPSETAPATPPASEAPAQGASQPSKPNANQRPQGNGNQRR